MRHGLRQTKMSSIVAETVKVHVRLSQSAGQTVPDSWWSCNIETSVAGPQDDADIGVGRTKMTEPRVVGNELVFLRHVCRFAEINAALCINCTDHSKAARQTTDHVDVLSAS